MAAARRRPELTNLNTTLLADVPQVYVDVDRARVLAQRVNLSDVYRTMQAFMGGAFVNYFNRFGRQWQVYVQADGEYRTRAEDIGQFYVANADGQRVPLSAVARIEDATGPEFTMRYNGYRSAQIIASAAPGYSSAQARRALEETFAQTMPPDMGYGYLGMSFQEQLAEQGVSPMVVFGALAARRLSHPRRAVRELVPALQRAAHAAGRRARRVPRPQRSAAWRTRSTCRSV